VRNDHLVIDADGHVMEPADLWDRYIDREFYGVRPICDPVYHGMIEVLGHRMSRSYEYEPYREAVTQRWSEQHASAQARSYDAASQVDAMDTEGIDVMVLYPSRGLYAASVADLDGRVASAICRAYNRWLRDFCDYAPERLVGVGLIGLQDPELATVEARYAVSELGMAGVMIRPNPYNGRNLHHRAYDGFYAALAELGAPVATHEGGGVFMPEYGYDRFEEHIINHAMCHPMEQMGAVASFTIGGVMERHPSLKVAILEAGGTWLPYWLSRLDEHVEWIGDVEARHLTMLPSEYFRRQGWIGFETDEPGLAGLVDYVGADRLLWASDYPHPDAKFPGMVDELFAADGLTEADIETIVARNPLELYLLGDRAIAAAARPA
jgi:predicted TIM-barrel fold metal-dependent hydrolase